MTWRIGALIVFFISLYGVLVFKLFTLQVEKGTWYVTQAQSREQATGNIFPSRGNIYFTDRSGNRIPISLNKEYPLVYAVPKELLSEEVRGNKTVRSVAEAVAPLIDESPEKLLARLSRKNDEYELLAAKASPRIVSEIKDLRIAGIYTKAEEFRFYPFGTLGAHLIGFASSPNEREKNTVGPALIGRYGIEQIFDRTLRGVPGKISGSRVTLPEDGGDVYLTIDRTVQAEGEDVLADLMERHKAAGGTFIVQEPNTGRILAMGSAPTFDPNTFSESNVGNFLNPAVQGVYEPGSIFKVITMAAGIDSGKVKPETTYVDKGSVTLNGRTITNWDLATRGAYGTMTMTGVIEHSINTGAVFAEQRTGHDLFYNYLIAFGLNDITGVHLPGEVRGSLRNLLRGREIDFATASYGQGVSVTPLALINSVSAIANGGLVMKPLILAGEKPEALRRAIKEETAKTIAEMMTSAVVKNKLAAISNYTIAGKTGTAFVPNFAAGGYTNDVINTFIGFAPASNPKFTILIKLDHPAGSPLAGATVVPAFRRYAQFLLNYFDISPDSVTMGNEGQ